MVMLAVSVVMVVVRLCGMWVEQAVWLGLLDCWYWLSWRLSRRARPCWFGWRALHS